MGLFGASSPFDTDIEKATSEKNTTEQWGVIMDICDKVGSSSINAKDCLKSIMKRLAHNDPHVVIQAITLLDACVNNCGRNFHLEVASREFENEFRRIVSKNSAPVTGKLVGLLKKWSEDEFKTDPQLNLIPSFYQKLKSEGLESSDAADKPKPQPTFSKDPNVVQSQQEADDIAKAIELSLKESKTASPKASAGGASSSSVLYPLIGMSGGGSFTSSAASAAAQEPRKVRALYDFEAAEDNELTFTVGEIIHVLDDSDPNWWKGYNQRGEGLFPSNFVTADLSVEPEAMRLEKVKKSVQFEDESLPDEEDKQEPVEINEEKIDRLLHLLHEANPEDPSQDTPEMLALELQVNQMGPLIDAELERVDRKHAQLTQLSSDLVEAINLYHTLMREPEKPPSYMPPAFSQQPTSMYMPQSMPGMYGMPPGGLYQLPPASSGPGMPPPAMQMMSHPQHAPPPHMLHQAMAGMSLATNVTPSMPPQSQAPVPVAVPPQMQNGHSSAVPPPGHSFPQAFAGQQQMPQMQSQMPPQGVFMGGPMFRPPQSMDGGGVPMPDKTNIPVYQQQR
ncbi:signal transducing adapter molecule 1 [Phlebotomus argentipes]|uniref:signal transducing adapter molecule 1 n=1 Tax=Phlebotomus argentipes TaxID=94469 RepID=UPI00289382DA|nr:signal transducing adapter molecule 1 [Phlebotomus argentipes]